MDPIPFARWLERIQRIQRVQDECDRLRRKSYARVQREEELAMCECFSPETADAVIALIEDLNRHWRKS